MKLSVVQLFYLLGVFWSNSCYTLPILYPRNSGHKWFQSLVPKRTMAETVNSLISLLQNRQGMSKNIVSLTFQEFCTFFDEFRENLLFISYSLSNLRKFSFLLPAIQTTSILFACLYKNLLKLRPSTV